MRDSLFGALGNISLATATTDAFSANYLDLGSIASTSRFTYHTTPPDLYACFYNTAALASGDYYIPFTYDDSDSGFATTPRKTAGPASATAVAINTVQRMRVPERVQRYLELGGTPESGSSFTAKTVVAYFELGAQPTTI